MSLTDARISYGVHSVSAYSRTTGEFYGIAKVLGGSSFALNGEQAKLMGGSQKYPWAIEEVSISSELSLKVKQYEDWMFTLFLGKAPTTVVTPDTDGTISTAANKTGSSMIAATGLLTPVVIPTTGAANLKFGKYVIKATGAAAFDVYMSSDIDHNRGTDEEFTNDLLLVASVTGVSSGGNSDVASLGLRFTGGASVTAFVTGDTATFEVCPPYTRAMEVTIGGSADTFPEFGAIVYAKQRSSGEMFEIDIFRLKATGLPFGMEMGAFSEAELKAEAFYDSAKNGVAKFRYIYPS